jgi:hypothetical protein
VVEFTTGSRAKVYQEKKKPVITDEIITVSRGKDSKPVPAPNYILTISF